MHLHKQCDRSTSSLSLSYKPRTFIRYGTINRAVKLDERHVGVTQSQQDNDLRTKIAVLPTDAWCIMLRSVHVRELFPVTRSCNLLRVGLPTKRYTTVNKQTETARIKYGDVIITSHNRHSSAMRSEFTLRQGR